LRQAVLVVDVINDFVSGAMGSERAARVVPNIRRLLDHARERGIPVVYVTDAHLPGIDHEFNLWPSHAVEGSEGAQIVEAIAPKAGDYHLKKRRYSAFHETGLDGLLRELKADTVIITGLVTDICVQHTAADAFFQGYRIVIPRDCVEARSDEEQEAGLRYMERNYGAETTTSEKLIQG